MRGKHGVQCVCGICIRQRTSEEAEQMEGTVPDLTSCSVSGTYRSTVHHAGRVSDVLPFVR